MATTSILKDDRVKVSGGMYDGSYGTVSGFYGSVSGLVYRVRLDSVAGERDFRDSSLELVPSPKVDDLVEITKPTGKWTAQQGHVVSVNAPWVIVDLDYEKVSFDVKDVRVIESLGPVRVEGKEIKPQDIKVGDEIRVSRTSGGMTSTRQGVVAKVQKFPSSRHKNPYLFNVLNGQYAGARLNWDEADETYTLIKAAPKVDEVLEALKAAEGGTAVYFGSHMARKSGMSEWWDVYSATGLFGKGTPELRGLIGKSHFQFLKPQK